MPAINWLKVLEVAFAGCCMLLAFAILAELAQLRQAVGVVAHLLSGGCLN